MNPPQQRVDHDPDHADNGLCRHGQIVGECRVCEANARVDARVAEYRAEHGPDVRPIGLGAELRAARAERDPLLRELADVDGGGGVGELATAYSELAELSAARVRALGRAAVDTFCGQRQQALDADRGVVLGMCGHWWQPRVVANEPVRAVLTWGAEDCPHCGRPPGVYILPGYEYEPERLAQIELTGESTHDK